MKKIILALALTLPLAAFSQNRLLNKFKNKVVERVDQRIDAAMYKTLDEAE